MYRLSRIMTLLVIIILPFFLGCEGPQGPNGSQGPQGPEGPIGPAGEDGSVMYSGQGGPSADIGGNGDYYLNQNTGELYGPKDSDGWGNPIIVLMGKDGADGQDGEDGSQIHSGSGAPDVSLGVVGDFYLDEANYDLYGPKTDSGWGSPLNLKGADGNANVTRYIYPEHDFQDDANGGDGPRAQGCIEGISEEEIPENPLNYYLVAPSTIIYSIPGYGSNGNSMYRAYAQYTTSTCNDGLLWRIDREDGDGELYDRIEIIRIEASNTEDNRKEKDAIIPDHLDFSDYEAVAEYYNFYRE